MPICSVFDDLRLETHVLFQQSIFDLISLSYFWFLDNGGFVTSLPDYHNFGDPLLST